MAKRAYKIEINPTKEQALKINKTIGTCRYVYNLYLAKNKECYENDGSFMSGYDFSKWLNNEYLQDNDVWIKEVSSKAVKQAIMNGNTAFKRFFKGESRFPRFKKKRNQNIKAYFPKNNKTDWTIERHRIKIPTIGWMRLKEFGYLPSNPKVISGTVSKQGDRYYVSVLCEVADMDVAYQLSNEGIGLDLGIKSFAITSNGKTYKNINKTQQVKKYERKLRREQRSLSRKYENKKRKRGETATNGANIRKNILRVQKAHAKLANVRLDYIKKIANELVKSKPMYITIEDLNISGMLKNKHLSKAVANQCFYTFKVYLTDKCKQYGIELRAVDRWYPSSKKCSSCGNIKSDLKLSDRHYSCECGCEMDRDYNASLNLKNALKYKILT